MNKSQSQEILEAVSATPTLSTSTFNLFYDSLVTSNAEFKPDTIFHLKAKRWWWPADHFRAYKMRKYYDRLKKAKEILFEKCNYADMGVQK